MMWHGGAPVRGDMLLPPSSTGKARVCHGDEWVYVTPRHDLALTYAATCNGWVYEVEPIGDLEDDPDSILPAGASMRCHSARILRRFKVSKANCIEVAAIVDAIDAALGATP